MKLRSSVCALLLCVSLLSPVASSVAAAPQRGSGAGISVPVVGTVPGGALNAVFNLTRVAVQNGQLVAIGTLTGTVTNAAGVVTSFVRSLALPITAQATCDILHLELGPLDLNLLGLVVHLDRIVLDIDAQAGPGNLLGNLLCAVAHLLDGGSLNTIANLLNQILGQL